MAAEPEAFILGELPLVAKGFGDLGIACGHGIVLS
jgi:hypothetical protein